MFGRVRNFSLVICQSVQLQQQRGVGTLKTLALRLKIIKNIQKITQSMKMVSATKYTRAERELVKVRPYGVGTQIFYEKVDIKTPPKEPKNLFIAITSDRGLCGGVHQSVAKLLKRELAKEGVENTKIVCVGEKIRYIIQRLYGNNIMMVAHEVGRKPPTFLDASKIANAIFASGYQFKAGKILYNKFKSIIVYKAQALPFYGLVTIETAPKLIFYEDIDNDVLESYTEYSLVSLIYYTMKEGATSEQSSRMTAMDTASKNAGEMIDKLSVKYNRNRQQSITNALIEVISGASAI